MLIGVIIVPIVHELIKAALMDLVDTSILERSLDEWFKNGSVSVFDIMTQLMNQAIKPVGYSILAIFFALELYKMSMKIEGAGGNPSLGVEPVFRSLIKLAICKVVVDKSEIIILAIEDVSIYCIKKMKTIFDSGSYATDLDEIINENLFWKMAIASVSLGAQIFFFIEGLLVAIVTWIAAGLVKIITMARMVEMLIYYTLSPIAIATFPSDEFSQIGKNYLKNVAALSFQGVILYLVITIYAYLVAIFIGGGGVQILDFLIYAVCIALAATSTGRLAKSMFNAS